MPLVLPDIKSIQEGMKEMFCYQFEQKPDNSGCTFWGVCGKDPGVLNVFQEKLDLMPVNTAGVDLKAIPG